MKVKDHDHNTGKYRGSTHQENNSNLNLSKKIPAEFHNLQSYNSHLIFWAVGKYSFKITRFTIKQSKKKGIKLKFPLVFIDSVRFLNSSLDNLVKNFEEKVKILMLMH